jgi:transcriptional regulator with XRE-family HTH domain
MATLLTLAVARRLADVTQDELAAELGVAQASLSYWESGAFPLPPKFAKRLLRLLKPRLRKHTEGDSSSTGRALRSLTAASLARPWDEVLLAAAGLTEEAG